jgi:hypothetical protein
VWQASYASERLDMEGAIEKARSILTGLAMRGAPHRST